MVRQRAEKIVIRGCKVRRIRWMLKDLPFKLLTPSQPPNRFLIAVHFFRQLTTCLATFLFQKCFEMVFVKFGFSLRGVLSMSKLPFLNFANHFLAVDWPMTPSPIPCKCPGLLQQLFGLNEKRRIAGVENVAFYPLDIPYVSLTNNKSQNTQKNDQHSSLQ